MGRYRVYATALAARSKTPDSAATMRPGNPCPRHQPATVGRIPARRSGRSALCYPRGRPRPRVAMTLRWTSLVPPRIVAGTMAM